jgi:hypothetical protein
MAVCYSGDRAQAAAALAPVHALGRPLFDLIRERPYVEVQSYLDETEPRGVPHYWKTEYLGELSDGLLSTLEELAAESEHPETEIGVLHIGGALNERAEDDGAVGNRDACYAVGAKAMWAPDDARPERFPSWVRSAWERLRPFSTGRTYINFQAADEGEERVRAAYGANYDRLVEVKTAFDPDNLFRSNRNVPPRRG